MAPLWLLLLPLLASSVDAASSPSCPAKCHCDQDSKTVKCQGQNLLKIPSSLPTSVEKLYLDHNLITTISNSSLLGLVNLKYLVLSNNKISSIEAGAFKTLSRLEMLFLSTNQLDSLKATAVQGATRLRYLNLEANRLKSIPSLGVLTSLQSLVLQGNSLTDLTFPRDFKYIKNLKDIVLSGNKFGRIAANAFTSLAGSNVQKLEVSRSLISFVDKAAFLPLSSLRSLKIGYNTLDAAQLTNLFTSLQGSNLTSLNLASVNLGGTLPADTFEALQGVAVTTLILSNNQIRQLTGQAFGALPFLHTLDLSHCGLDSVAPGAFQNLSRLEILFLKENQLSTVPTGLAPSLKKLYLNDNQFTELHNDVFLQLKVLEELYLGNNKIHQLSEDCLRGLSALKILHLSGNLIATLPSRLFGSLVRLLVLDLNNNNLQAALLTLNLAGNQCRYIPTQLLRPLQSLKSLKLEDNNLGAQLASDHEGLTFRGLRHLEQVFLQDNFITSLPQGLFKEMAELRHLNLRKNRLSHWGPELFQPTPKLQQLDLSENLVSVINQSSLVAFSSLTSLNLSSNPFQCDCLLCWFSQWVTNHTHILVDFQHYRCDSPPNWQGKPLSSFSCDKLNCIDYTMYWIAGSAAGVFVVCCLGFYLIYRKRWYIELKLYRLRTHWRRKPTVEGYTEINENAYEGYICYAEADLGWVRERFVRLMGQEHKLCCRDDDFMANRQEVSSFDDSLKDCQWAAIILSRNFIHDPWAIFQLNVILQQSIEKNLKIVVIQVGNLVAKQIPEQLDHFISRNDYIQWHDPQNFQEHFKMRIEDVIKE